MNNNKKQKKSLDAAGAPCDNIDMKKQTNKTTARDTDALDATGLAIAYFMDGNPRPKERPRFGRYGGVSNTNKTKSEELRQTMQSRAAGLRASLFKGRSHTGAVQVVLNYYIRPGKSKKTTEPHTAVPDVDNLAKLTLDAITKMGKFWLDDNQVNALLITKQYSKRPGVGVALIYNQLTRPDLQAGDFITRTINSPATQEPGNEAKK